MKKKYIAPLSQSFQLVMEGYMMTQSMGIGDSAGTSVEKRDEILSGKKENPIWSESNQGGMWNNIN